MTQVVIVAAKRTPQGRLLGSLAKHKVVDLAVAAGAAALETIGPRHVDLTIIGNVLAAGQGMNIARQTSIKLGIPIESPAFTVNMMCASGLKAIMLGADAVRTGEARVVLCGGAESMSNAPYLIERARAGLKLGDGTLIDTILRDGLVDAFDGEHMGVTAERLAREFSIGRADQDAFAATSQARYAAAHEAGRFADEIVPMGDVDRDEHPRPDTTIDSLAKLRPAFDPQGTVTAGNASGINDGAAMVVLCSRETAAAQNWPVLATIDAYATVGCEPARMGLGPVGAVRKLCGSMSCTVDDFDAVELNEAFAAQSLACMTQLELDGSRVNIDGGAIALGHPIGASGARLIVHLAHRMRAGDDQRTLATACVGGGMGAAMALAV